MRIYFRKTELLLPTVCDSSSFSVHSFHLVPEQRDETSGPPLMSLIAGPPGIIVDEVGFVYVSNFAGVGIL